MAKADSHSDYILLALVIILIILGILILASVSTSLAQERFDTTYYFLSHQLLFGLIPGMIFAFFVFRLSLGFLKKWVPFLLFINLIFMGMVFLPKVGTTLGGGKPLVNFRTNFFPTI